MAKCDVALWRTRGEHQPLVGEFAFQAKFNRKEDVAEKAKKLCASSSTSRCSAVKEWISLGVTKTGMVYRLKGNVASKP